MLDHINTGHSHAHANSIPRADASGVAAQAIIKPAATAYHHHFRPFNINRSSATSIAPNLKSAGLAASGVK
jgi:hypothetical protein